MLLHSRIRPVEEGKNRASQISLERIERIVHLPADFLYDLECLLREPRPHLRRIDILYPSGDLLEALWAHRDLSFLVSDHFEVWFHVVEGEPRTEDLLQSGLGDMSRTRFMGSPVLGTRHQEWQARILDVFRSALRGLASRALTQEHFEKRWTINLLQNLSATRAWAAWPEKTEDRRDGVLAAAGPSLADQIPLIRAKRHGIFLAAVDTALRPLLMAGLTPDLVVALDGGYFNTLDFEQVPGPEVPLAMDVACHPMVARVWRGPVALFASRPQEGGSGDLRERLLSQLGLQGAFPVVATAGHIAHTALGVLATLGFSRVGLAGLDMAYPFLESHSPSTCHQRFDYDRAGRLRPLPTGSFLRIAYRPLEPFRDADGETHWRDGGMASHPPLLERATRDWRLETAMMPGARVTHGLSQWAPEGASPGPGVVFGHGASHRKSVEDLLKQLGSFPLHDRVQALAAVPKGQWVGHVVRWPVVGPGMLATVLTLVERASSAEAERLSVLEAELRRFQKLVLRRFSNRSAV